MSKRIKYGEDTIYDVDLPSQNSINLTQFYMTESEQRSLIAPIIMRSMMMV